MKTRSAHTRILALLLCFSMLLSFAPAIQLFSAAHAAEGTGCCDADHTTFTLVGDGQAATLSGSGNFRLTSDIDLTNTTINVYESLHIDLNGFKIKGNWTIFTLQHNDAVVTLCDSSAEQTGGLYVPNYTYGQGVVYIRIGGTFNFYGGTISGVRGTKAECTAIYLNTSTAHVNMYGGKITDCQNTTGPAVYIKAAGSFNMYGGEISGNTASGYGGAIYSIHKCPITIDGGKILNNKSARGGAIAVDNADAVINIKSGEISGNSADNAGAIWPSNSGATLNISGGKITKNSTTGVGAAVYSNKAVVNISGGEITENYGTTVLSLSGTTFTMTGGTISGNLNSASNTGLAKLWLNNYGAPTTGAFSGNAVVENPVDVAVNTSTGSPSPSSATIGELTYGARILSNSQLTALDDTVLVSVTGDGKYLYTPLSRPNGITVNGGTDIQVEESAVGNTQLLTVAPNEGITLPTGYDVQWVVEDENVVTVDEYGLMTFAGYGSSKVTAYILDAEGNKTGYYNFVNVQVGETPLRILAIGDSFSRDSLYYISHLTNIYGQRAQAAYMELPDGALRYHALNLAQDIPAYTYYSTNPVTGEMINRGDTQAIRDVVNEDSQWDVIILSQAVLLDGFNGTYNEDLQYLLDFFADVQPDAKVYWNSTWSPDESGDVGGLLTKHYRGDPDYHYNAILDNLDKHILSGKFEGIDGWLPTGVAIDNLRDEIDDDLSLTRDGANLSLDIGRLTAAMAVLKALDPTLDLSQITADKVTFLNTDNGSTSNSNYEYSDEDLPKIITAVNAACADLSKAPARKTVDPVPTSENADVTVGQTTTPLMMHFPDVTVTSDDKVWVNAYVNVAHCPTIDGTTEFAPMYEGVGELAVWFGKQDYTTQQWQESYENPSLVITQKTLEDWGLVTISNRYERLKDSSDISYLSIADPRDGNLTVVNVDTDNDGDEEEMLLFTFWIRHYNEAGRQTGYNHTLAMIWATQDENGDWIWADKPQKLHPNVYNDDETWIGIKRGDIATFSDGNILIPCYSANYYAVPDDAQYEATSVVAMYMEFNTQEQQWVPIHRYTIPNFSSDEYATWNEVSLVAPDPDGNTVYAFGRESGSVMVSPDRGIHWKEVANETGRITQPSFTRIDDNRVFASWSKYREGTSLQQVAGKVFYVNGGWDATRTQVIYESPLEQFHDMCDSHCVMLPNGDIMVVHYDTAYNSIEANFVDVDASEYLPIELDEAVQEYTIYESDAQAALSDANAIPDSVKVYGAHTVTAKVTFTDASGQAVIATPAGSITLSDYAQGDVVNIIVKTLGRQMLVKAWKDGTAEPESWTALANQGTAAEQPAITGSGATLHQVAITCRMVLQLQESLFGKFADPKAQLAYQVQPEAAILTFTSSNEDVATVTNDGEVTFVSEGKAVITMKVNGIVELTCNVEVAKAPAEVIGEGETKVILWDDFEEDKYTDDGTDNELWDYYWEDPDSSRYILRNAVGMSKEVTEKKGKYNIVQEENGNQYLELKEPTTWMASAAEITGAYTVTFDVLFTGTGRSLNLTMWQNELVTVAENGTETATKGNEIHAFVNLQANAYRYQVREYSLFTHPSKTATDTQPVANPDLYITGDNVRSTTYDSSNGAANIWQSVKLVRVDGGLYMKVWNKYDADGALVSEPEEWTCLLNLDVLDADIPSHFRMQFDSSTTGQSVYVDNLKITQQKETGGTIALADKGRTLLFRDIIQMKYYFETTGFEGLDIAANSGLLIWDKASYDATAEHTYATAPVKKEGLTASGNKYYGISDGIPAKNMADVQVVIAYVKVANDTYVYSDPVEFSPKMYAQAILDSDQEEKWKNLVISMLNYGAAAQLYFNHNENDLVNGILSEAQKNIGWSDSYIQALPTDTGKFNFTVESDITRNRASLSFKGAINHNFYMNIPDTLTTGAQKIGMLYWTDSQYASVDVLTVNNASDNLVMTETSTSGVYKATIEGTAAKDLKTVFYTCTYVIDAQGEYHYGPLVVDSAHDYARRIMETTTLEDYEEIVALVKAMVVYNMKAEAALLS